MTLQIPRFCEGFEAAVVGFFHIIGEAARGQLAHGQMILNTVAANAFFSAA